MTKRLTTTICLIVFFMTLFSLPAQTAQARPLLDPVNPGTTSLVACWNLNETSGTRSDSYGANNLTDNNTVGSATGKIGNAANFISANSEYLSITDNSALSMGDIDFAISSWVYIADTSAVHVLVSKGNSANVNEREYVIYYANSNNRFNFRVGNGTTTNVVTANTFGAPSINTWYYVTAWHDATANTINIQVNNGTADSISYSGGSYNSTFSFALGAFPDASSPHNGNIDETVIYKRVLTSDERTWLYNSGSGRTCSDINPPTPTPTMTFTPSNTATNTATFTVTNTATFTPSNTPTDTATFTATNTPTATDTGAPTSTDTFTPTASYTPSATDTATPTATFTLTLTPSSTPGGPSLTPAVPTWYLDPKITYGEYALNIALLSLCGAVVVIGLIIFVILLVRRKKGMR